MKSEESKMVSERNADISRDPMEVIGDDIRELMKRCGSLQHQLDESGKNWENELKKVFLEFLEVGDAFENVFNNLGSRVDAADEQTKRLIGSFRTVYKMFGRALAMSNVTGVETIVGAPSNPYWHNIVETGEKPGAENGVILEEVRKGYLWKGKLLRPANICAVKNQKG